MPPHALPNKSASLAISSRFLNGFGFNVSSYNVALYFFQKMESLPDYVQFKPCPGTPLKDIFIAASDDLLEILEKMLTMDPCQRITAASVG